VWFAAYGNSIVHWAATLSISVFLPFFACHIYSRETARTFCILSQTPAWNSVEKIFIVRGEKRENSFVNRRRMILIARAYYLRFIAFPARISKGMTFRKITSLDNVDDFIGCEEKKISLCCFITPSDEYLCKTLLHATITLCLSM